MYHHSVPRVPLCAATTSGIVCTCDDDRKSASRYSFHAKTRTNRNVATSPGAASGSTIVQKVRRRDAPSIAAHSSSSIGTDWK